MQTLHHLYTDLVEDKRTGCKVSHPLWQLGWRCFTAQIAFELAHAHPWRTMSQVGCFSDLAAPCPSPENMKAQQYHWSPSRHPCRLFMNYSLSFRMNPTPKSCFFPCDVNDVHYCNLCFWIFNFKGFFVFSIAGMWVIHVCQLVQIQHIQYVRTDGETTANHCGQWEEKNISIQNPAQQRLKVLLRLVANSLLDSIYIRVS